MRHISKAITRVPFAGSKVFVFLLLLGMSILLFHLGDIQVGARHEPCHHDESVARKEAMVNLFTTMPESATRQIVKWFEKDIGYLKVNVRRFSTPPQLFAAFRTGINDADVVLSTFGVAVELKKREADYPCPNKDYRFTENRADKKGHWNAFALLPRVVAYNTGIPELQKIKTLNEIVSKKKLIGRIYVPISDYFWFYGLKTSLGAEAVKKTFDNLVKAKPIVARGTRTALDRILTGEAAVALAVNPWAVTSRRDKGAPIDYIPLKPVVTSAYTLSGLKTSPHPNAGRVFMKYLLQRSTQERLLSLRRYTPANNKVSTGLSELKQQELFIPDPEIYVLRSKKLTREFRKIMRIGK